MQQHARGPTILTNPLEQRVERLLLSGGHLIHEVAPGRQAKTADGGRIGLDDPEGVRPKQQHRLVRGVEQQAIARLYLAQLPILLLHRLLGGDQAGLQIGHGLQVAPDGDQPGFASKPDRGVLHRQLEAARETLGDLAEGREAPFASVRHHPPDLVTADVVDGVDPGASKPVGRQFLRHRVRQRRVTDDAVEVEHEGHVGGRNADAGQSSE